MRCLAAAASAFSAMIVLFLAQTYGHAWWVNTTRAAPNRLQQPEYGHKENMLLTGGEVVEPYGRGLTTAYTRERSWHQLPSIKSIKCNRSSLQTINACLSEHGIPKSFPDFIIIGWAKCSTTSLLHHLGSHPEVIKPTMKEPNFFRKCNLMGGCRTRNMSEEEYIVKVLGYSQAESSGFQRSTFEASVSYSQARMFFAGGHIQKMVPSVKIVACLREPISRMVSYVNYIKQHDIANPTIHCWQESHYECLKRLLQEQIYSRNLAQWIDLFPNDRIFLMQHEQLAADPNTQLRNMKEFLNINPDLPNQAISEMDIHNAHDPRTLAWVLTKTEYLSLLDIIKPDVEATIGIVQALGLDVDLWREKWYKIWEINLSKCSDTGSCRIFSSAP